MDGVRDDDDAEIGGAVVKRREMAKLDEFEVEETEGEDDGMNEEDEDATLEEEEVDLLKSCATSITEDRRRRTVRTCVRSCVCECVRACVCACVRLK